MNNISEFIYALEKYPVAVTILVAFIGILGIVMTQIIIHMTAEYDKKVAYITNYVGSLRLQVLDTHDRLALLRARRIEKVLVDGKRNSITYIEDVKRTCYADICSDIASMDWCYHAGSNLCSACYLIACLIAQCYRTKQHMEFLHLKKWQLNRLTDYLLKLEGIFDENFGIWQASQYDIALAMMDEKENIISFYSFCNLAKEGRCFVQLFDFYLSMADFGRRTQELDLIITLYDFYYFLESLVYPSVLRSLFHDLSSFFLRKHLLFSFSQRRFLKQMEELERKTSLPEGNQVKKKENRAPAAAVLQEKTEQEKALELQKYLYTEYPKNRLTRKKSRQKNRYRKLFMSHDEIAIQPISNYIIMKGIDELYVKKK